VLSYRNCSNYASGDDILLGEERMSQSPAPNDPSKGLPPWLLFAFLVAAPPAGIIALARTITQNTVVIALLVVLYEVLLFVVNFVGKIWGGLEKPLVDYIVEGIKSRTQEIASGYERQYCQHLVYEHQVFDVKGLSTQTAHALELEHVFVELSIDPKAPHQASADLLPIPEHLRQGEHSIWDYLSSFSSLANPHLVILGAPGSGKTTLLKHITLILAQHKQQRSHVHLAQTFPILLFLRDHAGAVKEQPDFSLADAVHEHIQKKWQQNVPALWIDRHLKRGKCLVLLDGLDEVADAATRQQMVAWVQRQMVAYGNHRFVLTSRPYGYRANPLDSVTVLEVHPFTPDQIERFVHNWYLANELKSWGKEDPGVHMRARGSRRLTASTPPCASTPRTRHQPAPVDDDRHRASLPEFSSRKAGSLVCRDLRGLSGQATGGTRHRSRTFPCSETTGASVAGVPPDGTRDT
jgi:energy-coupling factor transporter ATP-binding protein EcfA2